MRKFFIGLFQTLSALALGVLEILFALAFVGLEWFIPIAAALIPCFLIRRFLFPLPYWVFFVSGAVFFQCSNFESAGADCTILSMARES